MAASKKNIVECPYCKEEILEGAIKCKHCASALKVEEPAHEGICPYCKEEILEDAIKCKHCASALKVEGSAHEGTCPYCKEEIQSKAVKCKHCKSDLNGSSSSIQRMLPQSSGCGCGCQPSSLDTSVRNQQELQMKVSRLRQMGAVPSIENNMAQARVLGRAGKYSSACEFSCGACGIFGGDALCDYCWNCWLEGPQVSVATQI